MSLPGNDVFCIIKDANGNIWLGTNNGLALYDAANENFITFKNNKNDKYATLCSRILSIRQLKDNRLWIASELNGIAILTLNRVCSSRQRKFLLNIYRRVLIAEVFLMQVPDVYSRILLIIFG